MNPPASTLPASPVPAAGKDSLPFVVRRHLRFGWFALLLFLTLGLVLEALHGLKVQAYLNVMNETRRLMWTLAHAHGTLLALVNLAFAFTVRCAVAWPARRRAVASYSLIAASALMPIGFFVGGVWVYAGDPGLGIVLVPVGGALLFTAVLFTALSLRYFECDGRERRKFQNARTRD
jgi:hypothetical protein